MQQLEYQEEKLTFRQRLPEIIRGAWEIVKGVVLYVIIGIAIGATMHGYVPENFFGQYLGGGQWWTVPLAVTLAVPMYANGTGLPVMLFAFIIAFSMEKLGMYFKAITKIEKVMRFVAGLVFILTGLYYINIYFKII